MSLCFLVIWKYKRDNLGVFVDVFVSTKTYFEMFEIVTVRQVALNEIHGEVVYVDFPNWIPVKRQQGWPEVYSIYPAQFLMAETLKNSWWHTCRACGGTRKQSGLLGFWPRKWLWPLSRGRWVGGREAGGFARSLETANVPRTQSGLLWLAPTNKPHT